MKQYIKYLPILGLLCIPLAVWVMQEENGEGDETSQKKTIVYELGAGTGFSLTEEEEAEEELQARKKEEKHAIKKLILQANSLDNYVKKLNELPSQKKQILKDTVLKLRTATRADLLKKFESEKVKNPSYKVYKNSQYAQNLRNQIRSFLDSTKKTYQQLDRLMRLLDKDIRNNILLYFRLKHGLIDAPKYLTFQEPIQAIAFFSTAKKSMLAVTTATHVYKYNLVKSPKTNQLGIIHEQSFPLLKTETTKDPKKLVFSENKEFLIYGTNKYIEIFNASNLNTIKKIEPSRNKSFEKFASLENRFAYIEANKVPKLINLENNDLTISFSNLLAFLTIQSLDTTQSFYNLHLNYIVEYENNILEIKINEETIKQLPHKNEISDVVFSKDGSNIFVAHGNTVTLWTLAPFEYTFQKQQTRPLPELPTKWQQFKSWLYKNRLALTALGTAGTIGAWELYQRGYLSKNTIRKLPFRAYKLPGKAYSKTQKWIQEFKKFKPWG